MENNDTTLSYNVAVENGLLYFTFRDELSIQTILSSEAQALNLLNAKKIEILPFIVDLRAINDQAVEVEVRDFGKIISSRALFDRCSAVWIVGAKNNTKVLATLLNKTFLGNRIQFVDSLEEANKAAEAQKKLKIPMLEQDIV
jgi:hypothetical protein